MSQLESAGRTRRRRGREPDGERDGERDGKRDGERVDLSRLDLGQLALFVGQRMNQVVLERLHDAGHQGIRISHGYVIQHLIGAERSIGELAELMGVTQQAASKVAAELTGLGYLEQAESKDARERRLRLSARGLALLRQTRALRRRLEASLVRGVPRARVAAARLVLLRMLHALGGAEAVERRRVRPEDLPAVGRQSGRRAKRLERRER